MRETETCIPDESIQSTEYVLQQWLPKDPVASIDSRLTEPQVEQFRKELINAPPETILWQAPPQKEEIQPDHTEVFQADLAALAALQQEFDTALGIERESEQNGKIRAYNPVIARWNFEKLKTEEAKRLFKRFERFQMQTVLRERYHAATSAIQYAMDANGKLRNELFPGEPFAHVLLRGIAYRIEDNSPETEREYMEYVGFKRIQAKLTNQATPIGSKYIVISPPGLVENTAYVDNYVDIYEVIRDAQTMKCKIQMTRFASQITPEKYEQIAMRLQKDYFENEKSPRDGLYLQNGFYRDSNIDQRTAGEIFDQEFEYRKDAMKETEFQTLYEICLPLILKYLEKLCQDRFNPRMIALAYNAILRQGDALKRQLKDIDIHDTTALLQVLNGNRVVRDIEAEILLLGMLPIDAFLAGCGWTAGFVIGMPALGVAFGNSVARFGAERGGSRCTDCETSTSDDHYHCIGELPAGRKCNKKYASESKLPAFLRTKDCKDCGFKFSCN